MGKEIERKFLVRDEKYKHLAEGVLYKQGYLCSHHERVVRVRMADGKGFITVKGKNSGAVRAEYEYEIPAFDARQILENLCEKPIIEKLRYKVEYEGLVWEIDEFLGDNKGLVVAEIELTSENVDFPKPVWIGEEVTCDPRYFNSNLVRNPYKTW